MTLPVLLTGVDLAVIHPDTGEALPIGDAPDRALAHACEQIHRLEEDLREAKRALARELRDRHGVGVSHAGGYQFSVAESQSWPVGATADALTTLFTSGVITKADVDRAMPSKPKPDARQLKALISRLMVSDPDAARVLADACTTSPPSVREVRAEAVDEEQAA